MVKIFLSHNPEDLEVYFKNANGVLENLSEVVLNPRDGITTTRANQCL